jgi:UDP-glucose 4-epimerase
MKILVTGSNGFLGSRIADYLKSNGFLVFFGSRTVSESVSNVVRIDYEDYPTLTKACRDIDVVIHAAGMNALDSFMNPIRALEVNGVGSLKMAFAAKNSGVKKFIYFSTAHIYTDQFQGLIDENFIPNNLHPYATSHLAGEYGVLQNIEENGFQAVVLRLSNAFGVPTYVSSNCWRLLTNELCRQTIELGYIKLNTSGNQYRNFISITSLCNYILELLKSNIDLSNIKVANIGAENLTIKDMAQLIQKRYKYLFGKFINIIHDEGIPRKFVFNNPLVYDCRKINGVIKIPNNNIIKELDELLLYCAKTFK